jgi:hypothetical protein
MTYIAREKLIEFIKANDRNYNYSAVNFKFYSDRDLIALKKKLEGRSKSDRTDWAQIQKAV